MKHPRTSPAVSKRLQIYMLNLIPQNQDFKVFSDGANNR